MQTLFHLAPEAGELALGSDDVGFQLLRAHHDVLSFSDGKIADERDYVR